jgi:hypothetical protein
MSVYNEEMQLTTYLAVMSLCLSVI